MDFQKKNINFNIFTPKCYEITKVLEFLNLLWAVAYLKSSGYKILNREFL